MTMYQLRLPEHLDLDAWLDEVSWLVWDELTRHTQLEPLDPQAFVRIREILEQMLEEHVNTYRSCGLWSYCQAGTTPSPWTSPTAYCPEHFRVQWYILEVQDGLDELVEQAADRITELLFCLLGGSLPHSVIEANLETALRASIGRYLYENPHCGVSAFCQGRVPLNPWRKDAEEAPWILRPSTT